MWRLGCRGQICRCVESSVGGGVAISITHHILHSLLRYDYYDIVQFMVIMD